MGVSKVVINGQTKIDITDTTATASDVASDKYFYTADGIKTQGTASGGGGVIEPLSVTSNGTYTASGGVDGYSPVTVNVSGGEVEEGSVKFIDYDGTILYDYTETEAKTLTALPQNPSHSGLTAQGWNWTLEEIKTQIEKAPGGDVIVGQMYITDDGKTRIYITIEGTKPSTFTLYFGATVVGGVTIDWGDGATSTNTTTSAITYSHEYDPGNYMIALNVTSGKLNLIGSGTSDTSGTSIFGNRATSNAINRGRITSIEIGDNVSGIGQSTFYNCYNIKTVTIPNNFSTTSLGQNAFYRCYALKSIVVPRCITSFIAYVVGYCRAITFVSLPGCFTNMGNYGFYYSNCLQYVTIPYGVKTISSYLFESCLSLNRITIPSGVTTINQYAFKMCRSLNKINIPDTVTVIYDHVFVSTPIDSIIMPKNIRCVGALCGECNNLTTVSLPDNCDIVASFFSNCYALQTIINFPDNLTTIPNSTFYNCYSLKSITIPDTVKSIGNQAFYNCYNLKDINIPQSVTSIGDQAFAYSGISNVTLPDKLNNISASLFSYDYNLISVDIPEGVTQIKSNAFSNCFCLNYLKLPSTVTDIQASAFLSCYALELHLTSETPPTLANTNAFNNVPATNKIYVPYSADHSILSAYQTATNWSTYASRMVEEDPE